MWEREACIKARKLEYDNIEEDLFTKQPLEKFTADHSKHMKFISESIRFQRRDQLIFSAQTLKLNLSHCGFVKAYEVCASIEIKARQNDFAEMESLFESLSSLIHDINQ